MEKREALELDQSDVSGPTNTGGNQHFVTFVDDFGQMFKVHLAKYKAEVPEKFKDYETLVMDGDKFRIKRLHTNDGGEY